MSCAELRRWDGTLSARAAGAGVLSSAEREHLRVCAECRREVSRRDPSIPFALALAEEAEGAGVAAAAAGREREPGGDAEAMREAVRAMRRGEALAGAGAASASRRRAGLLAAAGLFGLAIFARPVAPPSPSPSLAAPSASIVQAGFAAFTTSPLVEDLDRPKARIYELADRPDDVSVVLIVDESLEI